MDDKDEYRDDFRIEYRDDVRMVLRENNQDLISVISDTIKEYLEKAIKKYDNYLQQKIEENDSEGIVFFTAALGTAGVIKEDLNNFFNEARNRFGGENDDNKKIKENLVSR